MNKEVHYLLSQKQLNRYAILQQLVAGDLTLEQAAASLGLSKRQVIRLKKRFIEEGPDILIHKNTNRKPIHALDADLAAKIVSLK